MAECCSLHILDLPDEIIFYIFSYLDEREQNIFGQVCHHWNIIANDQFHWNRQLLLDVGILNISKVTSRSELSECHALNSNGPQIKAALWDPFVLSRTLFAMCCPKIAAKKRWQKFLRESQSKSSLISKVKSLVMFTKEEEVIPKLVMFGPGLETPGISIIARQILKGQSSLFQAFRIINGGGVAVKYERQPVNFFLLYSNTQLLRKPLPAQERLNSSKLFAKVLDVWVPTDPVKLACQGCSFIVYVIDATLEIENIEEPFPDLTLIIQQTSFQYQKKKQTEDDVSENPLFLMVLACLPDESSARPDWEQLLYGLNLWKYNIPWQVSLITASNLGNISIPFDWAISRIKC